MKVEINEISLLDDDGTLLATMKVLDDVAMGITTQGTILTYDNINEFNDKIKEIYFMLFPEHKGK